MKALRNLLWILLLPALIWLVYFVTPHPDGFVPLPEFRGLRGMPIAELITGVGRSMVGLFGAGLLVSLFSHGRAGARAAGRFVSAPRTCEEPLLASQALETMGTAMRDVGLVVSVVLCLVPFLAFRTESYLAPVVLAGLLTTSINCAAVALLVGEMFLRGSARQAAAQAGVESKPSGFAALAFLAIPVLTLLVATIRFDTIN